MQNIIKKTGFILISTVMFLFIPNIFIYSKTIIVSKTGGDFSSIQKAVDSALSGDIIRVRGGVYHEAIVINKPGIIIEGYDLQKEPAIIDGSDQTFAAAGHEWKHVEGKIYKTTYTWPGKQPSDEEFMSYAGGINKAAMQVYEDGSILRGYRNRTDERFFKGDKIHEDSTGKKRLGGAYQELWELDPAQSGGLLPKIYIKPDILIPGRFLYHDDTHELFVWCARNDKPDLHIYNIPVLLHLIEIKANNTGIYNLVLRYASGYAITLDQSENCTIEGCLMINNHFSINADECPRLSIRNNFIAQRGFYERYWYDDCKGTLLWANAVRLINVNSPGCEISRNIITGFYVILQPKSKDARIFNNIFSYALSAALNCTEIDPKEVGPDYVYNLSIYNNVFHHCDLQSIGVSFIYRGPVYIYRNIFYAVNSILKCGATTPEKIEGKTWLYNNTSSFSKLVLDNPYVYAAENITVLNNIFHNQWYKFGAFHGWYSRDRKNAGWTSYFPFIPGPKFNYNIYWKTGEEYQFFGKFGIDIISNFTEYRDKTGLDKNSIWQNPGLAVLDNSSISISNIPLESLSSMNYLEIASNGYKNLYEKNFNRICDFFSLKNNSPCINAAALLPKNLPDSMPPRDGKPDMGALEFGIKTLLLE